MKRILVYINLIIMLLLISCSTTTRNENTALGAATGAILGGAAGNVLGEGSKHGVHMVEGAVIGALIGGFIGHYLNSTDHNSENPILANNPLDPIKTTSTWRNPKTNMTYQMTPKSNLYAINGNPNCRDYHFSSTRYGEMNQFDGRACQMADGHWKPMR